MPTNHIVPLTDRGVVRITGADATTLLDGLVTNSLARLDNQPAIHTGLLAPQGKILFDFFVIAIADGFLIDIDRAHADDLIKRLTFYRLRADVQFENVSDSLSVAALWPAVERLPGGVVGVPDPRNAELGLRLVLPTERLAEIPAETTTEAAYHAHRIAVGIPEAGLDYALGDTFPHEALYDQLHSIDFKKGCFVGQEVVSRMQHRGTARKRAMRVRADAPLVTGEAIEAGEAKIGTLGSASGAAAIAMIRLDRASEALAQGIAVRAGETAIALDPPDWIAFDVATGKPEADA